MLRTWNTIKITYKWIQSIYMWWKWYLYLKSSHIWSDSQIDQLDQSQFLYSNKKKIKWETNLYFAIKNIFFERINYFVNFLFMEDTCLTSSNIWVVFSVLIWREPSILPLQHESGEVRLSMAVLWAHKPLILFKKYILMFFWCVCSGGINVAVSVCLSIFVEFGSDTI